MRKIYVNELYEVCAVDSTDRHDLICYEVDDDVLGDWCNMALLGFKYEPVYQTDENGEFIFDGAGNKMQVGSAFSPFIGMETILAIQRLYKETIKPLEDENAQLMESNAVLELAILDIFEESETLFEAILDICDRLEE